jgi:hypothetical protein
MEKFWPPTRFFNMTNGPGERIMKQNVPLIVPNAVKQIATENISKIESLALEIKARNRTLLESLDKKIVFNKINNGESLLDESKLKE